MIASAQNVNDILFLKDGTVYRGSVVEYVPNEKVVIKLHDDRILTISADQLYTVVIDGERVLNKQFELKESGFFNQTVAGLLIGRNTFDELLTSIQLYMVNGWRLGQHHLGVGSGIENHLGEWYSPVYVE